MKLHANAKDLTGKVFGKLKVIKPAPKPDKVLTKERSIFWFCECECGNSQVVRSRELIVGDTTSCGCLRTRKYSDNPLFKGVGLFGHSLYSHIQWSAKKRNIEFLVSKEYLWELFQKQDGKCYYTGDDILLGVRNQPGGKTASLDRIDSSKGYTEGNLVWCHKNVNIMKMDKSEEQFYELCQKIINHRKNQNL